MEADWWPLYGRASAFSDVDEKASLHALLSIPAASPQDTSPAVVPYAERQRYRRGPGGAHVTRSPRINHIPPKTSVKEVTQRLASPYG
jgi:hypothetical protein